MIAFRFQLGVLAALWAGSVLAIGTAVTVQGTLDDAGVPANGMYDLTFQVRNSTGALIGPLITIEDRTITQGVFTVQADFGPGMFTGLTRSIAVGVRPGTSTGAFTPLSPDVPVQPAPYAQLATDAEAALFASTADDVTDNAIDEIDINTSAVSARTIASGAVGNSELATDSVSNDKLQNDAVSNAELQNNAVSIAKLLGANYTSPANLNATIPANACGQFDVTVSGGFNTGDFVIGMPNSTFPSNIILSVGVVVSTNQVRMRFCNVGSTSQALVNEQIRLISLR